MQTLLSADAVARTVVIGKLVVESATAISTVATTSTEGNSSEEMDGLLDFP